MHTEDDVKALPEVKKPDGRLYYENILHLNDTIIFNFSAWCPICRKAVPARIDLLTGKLIATQSCDCTNKSEEPK